MLSFISLAEGADDRLFIIEVPRHLRNHIVSSDLRSIMEKLTAIVRQTLGEENGISTSPIDAPIEVSCVVCSLDYTRKV